MSLQRRYRERTLRPLVLLIGLCALLPLAGAQDAADSAPPLPNRDFAGQPAHAVLKVSAGNELVARINGTETTLRLIGTYIPQSGPAADEARAFISRLLDGESVYVGSEPDWPERDRDGRVWAYIYRAPDGLFVNLELVRLGNARVSAAAAFEHQELLRAYERVAQKNRKGLWSERAKEAEAEPASRPTTQPAVQSVAEPVAAAEDGLVYVTEHGKKYHRRDCQFVRSGATALTLQEAKARSYTPCARCKPPK